jgi:hypothetical protein
MYLGKEREELKGVREGVRGEVLEGVTEKELGERVRKGVRKGVTEKELG